MKNTLWNSEEIAAATQGEASGAWLVNRVIIDSREACPGDLFVALSGTQSDGHAYVQNALNAGASGAIVTHVPEGVDPSQCVKVDNTELALQRLGIAGRARANAKIVGVTGSVGKTGSKEMLRHVLSMQGHAYATEGNYNNHLGVPLTLANMPRDTDYAVIEMGMNHAGEISQLSQWVRPHIALITTIAEAHLEFFKNVEAIADAKAEIFDGMAEGGVAVLNRDNPYFERLYKKATKAGLDRILSFGADDYALCRLLEYRIEQMHSVVDAVVAGTRLQYNIGAVGRHWGLVSVAVLGVADALGLDLARAAESLAHFEEPQGRGRIEELRFKGGNLRLVDDSYNANPMSMVGAIEKLAMLRDGQAEPVRTIAVLGDMLELGHRSRDLHVGLAPTLVNNQIDLVFAAGEFMHSLYESLPESMRGEYDTSALKLAPKVVNRLTGHDLVLVKGSNGSRISNVSQAIRDAADR